MGPFRRSAFVRGFSRRPGPGRRLYPESADDVFRSLALIVEPTALRASIIGRVRELIGCDAAVLCSFRSEEGAYTSSCSTQAGEPLRLSFAATGSLARWLRANQETFQIPHPRGAFEFLGAEERAQLLAVHARACVPLFSGARLTDMLLLCTARADWRPHRSDLELLERLGRHAALALENAELHQAERERIRQAHQAEQLAVAGQLAATVAHEIRNPLSAIRSTVQYVMESGAAWEKKREFLAQILGEVDRIEQTVGSVLSLSRPRELALEDIDLIHTIQQSLLLISAYAKSRKIRIERQFQAESLPVRGDPGSLHQVWVNLLLNACQAMPDGGTIAVRCGVWHRQQEDGPVALVRISDTGCGISDAHLSRIFDPFFTTKSAGTGLGLPVCVDILSRHGGSLRLESAPGAGTDAIILVPVRV
jgi:signal transduction histidine kinase